MSLLLGGLNVTMRIPPMTTTTPQVETTPTAHQNNISSQEGEELSADIQGAKAKVVEAEKWDRRASRTNIALLVLYGLITGAVVISSVWSIRTSGRLRNSEKLLNDLEKAKIRADAERQTKAETQKVREEARIEIGRVESESREKVEALKLEAELARKEIVESQRELERERLTRLELERSLAPRVLVSSSDAIRRLQRFAGTKYILEFVPDAETEHLVSLIAWNLTLADWEQLRAARHFDTPIRDGIAIETGLVNGNLLDSARDLAEFLEANNLRVFTASLKEGFRLDEIPKGTVRIRVGFKPNPYFEDKLGEEASTTAFLLNTMSTPGLIRRELTEEEIKRLRSEWRLS
jgi:hypothetical protein